MTDAPSQPPLPPEIGGYRIQRLLGAGGMALVYAARQQQPHRVVALKVLKAGVASDLALRRLRREIEILGKLRHPYIAQVYDAGTHDDGSGPVPFFVMEYVPGARTIVEHVAAEQLSIPQRVRLLVKVCSAVEHGHRRRIIHRDLKPGNILIDESGQPKVIDFGVARAADLDRHHQTMHTESGRIVGTILYMAPEQIDPRPRDLDARCDVYALGVILFKLLTTKMPYELRSLPVVTAAQVIREQPPARPSAINPELRGDLEAILLKALEKEPRRRYRDAGQLGRDLLRYLDHEPIRARRAGAAYRVRLWARRHRAALVGPGLGLAVVAVGGTIVTWQSLQTAAQRRDLIRQAQEQQPPPPAAAVAPAPVVPPGAVAAEPPAREPFELAGQAGRIHRVRFDPAGTALASAAADHSAVVRAFPHGDERFTALDHDEPVRHLAFSGDGSILVTASDDGSAVVLESGAGRLLRRVRTGAPPVTCLAVSPDGRLIAVGTARLLLEVWGDDDDADGPHLVLRGARGALISAAFDGSATRLAAGAERDVVYVWDVETGLLLRRLDGLAGRIIAVGFAADDARVVAAAQDGRMAAWRPDGPDAPEMPVIVEGGPDPLVDAAIDPTGRWLVAAGADQVRLWDLQSDPAREAWRFTSPIPVHAIAVSPDGAWCAIGGDDGTILVQPTGGSD